MTDTFAIIAANTTVTLAAAAGVVVLLRSEIRRVEAEIEHVRGEIKSSAEQLGLKLQIHVAEHHPK